MFPLAPILPLNHFRSYVVVSSLVRSTFFPSARPVDLVCHSQRLLSTITSTVLRAVVRHHLPGVDPAVFLELVDSGEGEGTDDRIGSESSHSRRLSSTPLRMCRYAGADGVAFGETLADIHHALNTKTKQKTCLKNKQGWVTFCRMELCFRHGVPGRVTAFGKDCT